MMVQQTSAPTTLELLAPARNVEIARRAILHGADAVYIGADAFGARVSAANSVDDIASLVTFAHLYNARVYVTLNTVIYENELKTVEALIRRLYASGVDALIVQDMSILRMDIPPIALHASTQCDTRTPGKARFLQDCGFSQIVLARELSLDQIREISETVSVPLEVFVHGALCVSYSGDCQASLLATGRSANRGECAQMCRLPYSLTDASGRKLAPDAHYLSLRDMNRLDRLADLAEAGVRSFKIEGRLKDSAYVCNTVAAYSIALDRSIASSQGRFVRASSGRVELSFEPDVNLSFNRRFTDYFLDGRPSAAVKMSSADSPKWIGVPVGTVVAVKGNAVKIRATAKLNNGDGLGYFDDSGRYVGFRVNRVEGDTAIASSAVKLRPGTRLYRNRDKQRDDIMASDTAVRLIPVSARLRRVDDSHIALSYRDDRGIYAEILFESQEQTARTPQREQRRRTLARLGDTVYVLDDIDDQLPDDSFVAASVLTNARRQAIDALETARLAVYHYDYRRPESRHIDSFRADALDRHDNIANSLAERFYADHDIEIKEKATELLADTLKGDVQVMATRYCIRRELGACLRTPDGRRLPSPLFLRASGVEYRLDFDCQSCSMKVIAAGR